ncbi:CDP-alcohol phosphatidyltransferase family protein [Photobacterium lipolyticum]|uniref:CDP-diacylglycerol--glycerol-3-phosphate 3-phosphatidyltransferase n=1 Tax=Photobacterium lipolyticum TaxID=266810 RepID=A0A2T3MWM6_9GAMM|nr:CDP-alcohol phosphatidyltransferase family protein [Photobacterium lipolyticum]PSW04301.1 CDP-alcohol phosphatidyltransferase family protein [Photobacterium lipolyticum]
MTSGVIKLIPNIITTLRLILALPICLLILDENYPAVLWIAFVAGLSDGVDGWFARKMNAESRYGAIVDPLSDKAMLISAYIAFVVVGLLPWWVAVIIVMRDVVIITGALAYHWRFGRYDVAPSIWGKASTAVQILYALMLLTHQVYPVFPVSSFQIGLWLVIIMVVVSGGHYVYTWGVKARALQKGKNQSDT